MIGSPGLTLKPSLPICMVLNALINSSKYSFLISEVEPDSQGFCDKYMLMYL